MISNEIISSAHDPLKLIYIERSYLDAFADIWPGFRSLVDGVNHLACVYEVKTGDLIDMTAYDNPREDNEVDLSDAAPGSGLSELFDRAWANACSQGSWDYSGGVAPSWRNVTEFVNDWF